MQNPLNELMPLVSHQRDEVINRLESMTKKRFAEFMSENVKNVTDKVEVENMSHDLFNWWNPKWYLNERG